MIRADTAGSPVHYYDMCAYCNLDTGGNHEGSCPLASPRIVGIPFGESYSNLTKRAKAEIGNHPEWRVKCL